MADIKLKDLLSEGKSSKVNEIQLNESAAAALNVAIASAMIIAAPLAITGAHYVKGLVNDIRDHYAGKKIDMDAFIKKTAEATTELDDAQRQSIAHDISRMAIHMDEKSYKDASWYMGAIDDRVKEMNDRNNSDYSTGLFKDAWLARQEDKKKNPEKYKPAPEKVAANVEKYKDAVASEREINSLQKDKRLRGVMVKNPVSGKEMDIQHALDMDNSSWFPAALDKARELTGTKPTTQKPQQPKAEKDPADTNRDAKLQQLAKLQQQKAQQDKQKAATGGASANQQKAAPTQQPNAQPAQDISKLKVKNPETGNDISVKAALTYDKNHPVYKAAQQIIARNRK